MLYAVLLLFLRAIEHLPWNRTCERWLCAYIVRPCPSDLQTDPKHESDVRVHRHSLLSARYLLDVVVDLVLLLLESPKKRARAQLVPRRLLQSMTHSRRLRSISTAASPQSRWCYAAPVLRGPAVPI